jgi:hypothetical protein
MYSDIDNNLDKYYDDYIKNKDDYVEHPEYDNIIVNKKYSIPSTDGFNHNFKYMFGMKIVEGETWSKTSVYVNPSIYLKKEEYLEKYCKYYDNIGKYLLNKYNHQ